MKITWIFKEQKHRVAVEGNTTTFNTSKDACEFIDKARKEAA